MWRLAAAGDVDARNHVDERSADRLERRIPLELEAAAARGAGARAVADGVSDVGIVIDGGGEGSAMATNKVPGVRAAACYSVAVARNSREHNDANVLTLGSKTITSAEMREIVTAWLSTEISEDLRTLAPECSSRSVGWVWSLHQSPSTR